MYEELINLLRRCGEQKCKNCEYEHVLGCVTKMNERAADAIEVLSKKEKTTQWIPVTERLPEDRVPVLATYIGFCTGEKSSDLLVVRFEDMWCYWDGNPCSYDECKVKITHWMPLPEPPKEE